MFCVAFGNDDKGGKIFFLPFCAAGARTDRFSLPNPLKFSADEISLGIFFSLSGYPSSHTYLYNLTRLGNGGRAKKQEKVSLARKGKKRKSFSLYFPPIYSLFSLPEKSWEEKVFRR